MRTDSLKVYGAQGIIFSPLIIKIGRHCDPEQREGEAIQKDNFLKVWIAASLRSSQ
jgi:hypothetical protein